MERIVKCHIDVVHKRTSKKTKRLQNIIGNRQEPKQKKNKSFIYFLLTIFFDIQINPLREFFMHVYIIQSSFLEGIRNNFFDFQYDIFHNINLRFKSRKVFY